MIKLTNFKINKLHGYKSYNLKFKDNTLILVGENGAGKTTVLKLLCYVLSSQWEALSNFKFTSITLKIDNQSYSIKPSDLKRKLELSIAEKSIFRNMSIPIRRKISRLIEEAVYSGGINQELRWLAKRYNIPWSLIRHAIENGGIDFQTEKNRSFHTEKNDVAADKLREIRKALGDTKILYLPTYRRIEQELGTIFKGIDEEDLRDGISYNHKRRMIRYTELVEFGMKDVEKSIINTLSELKEFARESLNFLTLGYLGDVVDEKYTEVDVTQIKAASNETIKNIVDRIEEDILSKSSKKHLSETIENVKKDETLNVHAKVICHYFIKLLNFQQELEKKELSMRSFCEVCNNYMEDKSFEYTSSSFSFSILPLESLHIENEIKLEQLSSGEKQIVSLFSHLYLSNENNYFILIDEPELSLSVPWQRQFLVDIKKGDFCSGLIAVTHSPFIYDNELETHAHGLGEFLSIGIKK